MKQSPKGFLFVLVVKICKHTMSFSCNDGWERRKKKLGDIVCLSCFMPGTGQSKVKFHLPFGEKQPFSFVVLANREAIQFLVLIQIIGPNQRNVLIRSYLPTSNRDLHYLRWWCPSLIDLYTLPASKSVVVPLLSHPTV